ncbi:hypothetical protein HUJ04_011169 [Dendroctonus ponderosae]|nr:hypothetical protein HUJ04_011169 [Dendroctonus ponderosae]
MTCQTTCKACPALGKEHSCTVAAKELKEKKSADHRLESGLHQQTNIIMKIARLGQRGNGDNLIPGQESGLDRCTVAAKELKEKKSADHRLESGLHQQTNIIMKIARLGQRGNGDNLIPGQESGLDRLKNPGLNKGSIARDDLAVSSI